MAKTIKIEIPVQAIVKTPAINVEVPEGCIAKYDASTQTVKFVPAEKYTSIKDFETACEVLGISSFIPHAIQVDRQLCAMYKMQIVLKAVNQGYTFDLLSGVVWYPNVRFIDKSNVGREKFSDEYEVLDFNYDDRRGRTFTLVGGSVYSAASDGLACFNSAYSVGHSYATSAFFACYDEQRARHVSKYFAPLIFDCCFARELKFSLSNGEMVTKNYHIENKN